MTKEGFLKQVPLVKMSKDIEFSINFHKDVIFHMRCHLSYEVSTIGVILKFLSIKQYFVSFGKGCLGSSVSTRGENPHSG